MLLHFWKVDLVIVSSKKVVETGHQSSDRAEVRSADWTMQICAVSSHKTKHKWSGSKELQLSKDFRIKSGKCSVNFF